MSTVEKKYNVDVCGNITPHTLDALRLQAFSTEEKRLIHRVFVITPNNNKDRNEARNNEHYQITLEGIVWVILPQKPLSISVDTNSVKYAFDTFDIMTYVCWSSSKMINTVTQGEIGKVKVMDIKDKKTKKLEAIERQVPGKAIHAIHIAQTGTKSAELTFSKQTNVKLDQKVQTPELKIATKDCLSLDQHANESNRLIFEQEEVAEMKIVGLRDKTVKNTSERLVPGKSIRPIHIEQTGTINSELLLDNHIPLIEKKEEGEISKDLITSGTSSGASSTTLINSSKIVFHRIVKTSDQKVSVILQRINKNIVLSIKSNENKKSRSATFEYNMVNPGISSVKNIGLCNIAIFGSTNPSIPFSINNEKLTALWPSWRLSLQNFIDTDVLLESV
jgi:hypothetical protein